MNFTMTKKKQEIKHGGLMIQMKRKRIGLLLQLKGLEQP